MRTLDTPEPLDSYKTYSDEQLLALLKDGNDLAFDAIYHRYWKRLFVVAFKKLADLYIAEELVQDIFIKLWERKTSLTIEVPLSAYLSAAVKYKTIDACLKQKSSKSNLRFLDPAIDSNEAINPFTQMLEFEDQLSSLISRLSEKCQMVFQLSKKDGFSHKEIANHLDISEKTVEYHIAKAIKLLRSGFGNLVLVLSLLH